MVALMLSGTQLFSAGSGLNPDDQLTNVRGRYLLGAQNNDVPVAPTVTTAPQAPTATAMLPAVEQQALPSGMAAPANLPVATAEGDALLLATLMMQGMVIQDAPVLCPDGVVRYIRGLTFRGMQAPRADGRSIHEYKNLISDSRGPVADSRRQTPDSKRDYKRGPKQ